MENRLTGGEGEYYQHYSKKKSPTTSKSPKKTSPKKSTPTTLYRKQNRLLVKEIRDLKALVSEKDRRIKELENELGK